MNALPKSVKIGALTFDVVEEARTAIDGKYGALQYCDSVISLTPGMSIQHQTIVLWHEMIHAMLTNAGIREQDEQIPMALSHGIVQLLQDNPALR